MKLQTSIPPRRDGVVNVTGQSGIRYKFMADESGALACEVENKDDIARLLLLGDFFPANEADNLAAVEILQEVSEAAADADLDPEQPDAGPVDDLPDDDPIDPDAAPIEMPAAAPIEAPAAAAPAAAGKRRAK